MARLSKTKEFFIARDLDRPEAMPGELVAVYWEDWDAGRAVLEGWRGPEMDSEDFGRRRLEPYRCLNLVVDLGGYWDCFQGTVIG